LDLEDSLSTDVMSTPIPRHVPAGEGTAIWAMGSLFEMKLEPGDTGGALGMALVCQPAGVATPLHRHTREAEVFYLLDGRVRYEAGGVEYDLTAGSTMYLPVGDARVLAIVAPGGLLDLYSAVGVPATERAVPSVSDGDEITRWNRAAPRYGLQVLGPPLNSTPTPPT
jgi:quercetin dioxygenase-like cupin family protein